MGAFSSKEHAARAHDVMALKAKAGMDDLNYPEQEYAALQPHIQGLPQSDVVAALRACSRGMPAMVLGKRAAPDLSLQAPAPGQPAGPASEARSSENDIPARGEGRRRKQSRPSSALDTEREDEPTSAPPLPLLFSNLPPGLMPIRTSQTPPLPSGMPFDAGGGFIPRPPLPAAGRPPLPPLFMPSQATNLRGSQFGSVGMGSFTQQGEVRPTVRLEVAPYREIARAAPTTRTVTSGAGALSSQLPPVAPLAGQVAEPISPRALRAARRNGVETALGASGVPPPAAAPPPPPPLGVVGCGPAPPGVETRTPGAMLQRPSVSHNYQAA